MNRTKRSPQTHSGPDQISMAANRSPSSHSKRRKLDPEASGGGEDHGRSDNHSRLSSLKVRLASTPVEIFRLGQKEPGTKRQSSTDTGSRLPSNSQFSTKSDKAGSKQRRREDLHAGQKDHQPPFCSSNHSSNNSNDVECTVSIERMDAPHLRRASNGHRDCVEKSHHVKKQRPSCSEKSPGDSGTAGIVGSVERVDSSRVGSSGEKTNCRRTAKPDAFGMSGYKIPMKSKTGYSSTAFSGAAKREDLTSKDSLEQGKRNRDKHRVKQLSSKKYEPRRPRIFSESEDENSMTSPSQEPGVIGPSATPLVASTTRSPGVKPTGKSSNRQSSPKTGKPHRASRPTSLAVASSTGTSPISTPPNAPTLPATLFTKNLKLSSGQKTTRLGKSKSQSPSTASLSNPSLEQRTLSSSEQPLVKPTSEGPVPASTSEQPSNTLTPAEPLLADTGTDNLNSTVCMDSSSNHSVSNSRRNSCSRPPPLIPISSIPGQIIHVKTEKSGSLSPLESEPHNLVGSKRSSTCRKSLQFDESFPSESRSDFNSGHRSSETPEPPTSAEQPAIVFVDLTGQSDSEEDSSQATEDLKKTVKHVGGGCCHKNMVGKRCGQECLSEKTMCYLHHQKSLKLQEALGLISRMQVPSREPATASATEEARCVPETVPDPAGKEDLVSSGGLPVSKTPPPHTATGAEQSTPGLVLDVEQTQHSSSDDIRSNEVPVEQTQHSSSDDIRSNEVPVEQTQHSSSDDIRSKEVPVEQMQHSSSDDIRSNEVAVEQMQHSSSDDIRSNEAPVEQTQHSSSDDIRSNEVPVEQTQHSSSDDIRSNEVPMEQTQHSSSDDIRSNEVPVKQTQHSSSDDIRSNEVPMEQTQHSSSDDIRSNEVPVEQMQHSSSDDIRSNEVPVEQTQHSSSDDIRSTEVPVERSSTQPSELENLNLQEQKWMSCVVELQRMKTETDEQMEALRLKTNQLSVDIQQATQKWEEAMCRKKQHLVGDTSRPGSSASGPVTQDAHTTASSPSDMLRPGNPSQGPVVTTPPLGAGAAPSVAGMGTVGAMPTVGATPPVRDGAEVRAGPVQVSVPLGQWFSNQHKAPVRFIKVVEGFLFTATTDGWVHVFSASTHGLVYAYDTHMRNVTSFDVCGDTFLLGCSDGRLCCLEWKSAQPNAKVMYGWALAAILSLKCVRGNAVVGLVDGRMQIFSTLTATALTTLRLYQTSTSIIALETNQQFFVSASTDYRHPIYCWRVQNFFSVNRSNPQMNFSLCPIFALPTDTIISMLLNNDMLFVSTLAGILNMFDLTNRCIISYVNIHHALSTFCFSVDRLFATTTKGEIVSWSLKSPTVPRPAVRVTSMADFCRATPQVGVIKLPGPVCSIASYGSKVYYGLETGQIGELPSS